MISLEKARVLKEAGLVWGWKEGDFFIISWDSIGEIHCCWSGYSGNYHGHKDDIWLPRLDQLLAELEKRGYRWDIGNLEGKYLIGLFDWESREYIKGQFYADTPEEAAAEALIWILKQEVSQ